MATNEISWPGSGERGWEPQDCPAAEQMLAQLAAAFGAQNDAGEAELEREAAEEEEQLRLNAEARYQALVEQIPAVVFMVYLDKSIGEAYVSPQIEAALGFSQREWLEDPVRWYRQIHPEDKARWSNDAAEMFLSGKGLRSAYRILARDGRALWFHCEAKMIRRKNGRPWFIHGVGFDITDLKAAEDALDGESKVLSTILDTVQAMVAVLDADGRIVRSNQMWEQITGFSGGPQYRKPVWELFPLCEDTEYFREVIGQVKGGTPVRDVESSWITSDGEPHTVCWTFTALRSKAGATSQLVVTGVDVTERRRVEQTVLEISAREQRRIGQDLHDDLGQHLTGIAFLSKVMAQRLAERSYIEAKEAEKIVRLVNEAIEKTRELAHGLLPVVSEGHGLMSALERWADEVESLCATRCRFECEQPVLIEDVAAATHLYHIAQEAVNNAIKHGKASEIRIRLASDGATGTLIVDDNGMGFEGKALRRTGMGLGIMSHRANMMGGSLDVRSQLPSGTRVTCIFPVRAAALREVGNADAIPNAAGLTQEPDFPN